MNKEAGNRYELAQTARGVPTLRHLQTGELLHGQVGPECEAEELYIACSRLRERTEPAVVYDIGMGAGAQTLALLELVRSGTGPSRIEVHSFDLEKDGLEALRSSCDVFPQAQRSIDFLEAARVANTFEARAADGRSFHWVFHGGDFHAGIERVVAGPIPAATDIFFDFFSPASHPSLWTVDVFERLLVHASPKGCRLITYPTATCVRAALLAAGWFVGTGPCSGKKSPSIVAANRLDLISEPLEARWLQRFERSDKQFTQAEVPEMLDALKERVRRHAQFT